MAICKSLPTNVSLRVARTAISSTRPTQPSMQAAANRRRTLVVPTLYSADPKGSANRSRGIRGYISLMATTIVKNNRGTFCIGDVSILYDRQNI